jgi:hypothetical protein
LLLVHLEQHILGMVLLLPNVCHSGARCSHALLSTLSISLFQSFRLCLALRAGHVTQYVRCSLLLQRFAICSANKRCCIYCLFLAPSLLRSVQMLSLLLSRFTFRVKHNCCLLVKLTSANIRCSHSLLALSALRVSHTLFNPLLSSPRCSQYSQFLDSVLS